MTCRGVTLGQSSELQPLVLWLHNSEQQGKFEALQGNFALILNDSYNLMRVLWLIFFTEMNHSRF